MRAAGTNQPYGKAYTRAFGDWMAERPWTKHLETGTRNHLFWVADHRSEIEAWRATLSPARGIPEAFFSSPAVPLSREIVRGVALVRRR
jgi:hypothetical protein